MEEIKIKEMEVSSVMTNQALDDFVKIYGGLSNMRDKFPKTYEAYTRSQQLLKLSTELEATTFAEKSPKAAFKILNVGYTDVRENHVYVDVMAELIGAAPDKTSNKTMIIKAFDRESKRYIEPSDFNVSFKGNMQVYRAEFPLGAVLANNLDMDISFYNSDAAVVKYPFMGSLNSVNLDVSGTFSIKHPSIQKSRSAPWDKTINVAVVNKTFSESERDYYYSKDDVGADKSSYSDYGYFTLDSKGSIEVKGGEVIGLDERGLKYVVNGKLYHHTVKDSYFTIVGNKVEWDIPKRSNIRYDAMGDFYWGLNVGYLLNLRLNIANQDPVYFYVTNLPGYEPDDCIHVIKDISVKWDCFLKGSKIKTDLQNEMAVENLKPGDKVLTDQHGNTAKIREITGSQACVPVSHIVTEDGLTVSTTVGHMFVTGNGLRYSHLIEPGDTLKTADGVSHRVKSVTVEEGFTGHIYYLALEGTSNRLYVSGFLAGDSDARMNENEKAVNERCAITPDWRKDYDGWMEMKEARKMDKTRAKMRAAAIRDGLEVEPESKTAVIPAEQIVEQAVSAANRSRVSDVVTVKISSNDKNYIYEAIADEMCEGDVEVVLNREMSGNPKYRVEAASTPVSTSGRAIVSKSLINKSDMLYLYLRDKITESYSNIVNVYSEPLTLKRWIVTEDNALVFVLDRDIARYDLSNGLCINYIDRENKINTNILPLPETKAPLQNLGIWRDTVSFTFQLRLLAERKGVKVYCAPTEMHTAYIAPPPVSGIVLCGGELKACCGFTEAPLSADLYAGDVHVSVLQPVEAHTFKLPPEMPGGVYSVRFCIKTLYGESLKTAVFPVITALPQVTGCVYADDNAVITLRDIADYEIAYHNGGQRIVANVSGGTLTVPSSVERVNLRLISGVSKGGIVTYELFGTGYYPFNVNDGVFYSLRNRPFAPDTGTDIDICSLPAGTSTHDGNYFHVSDVNGSVRLTAGKALYESTPELLRTDYEALLAKYSDKYEVIEAIRNAVKLHMPMRAEDILYFHYDCDPAAGCTGIYEGMSLLTEYAAYHGSPRNSMEASTLRTDKMTADTVYAMAMDNAAPQPDGFIGTGMARYQAIRRGGKITFDPFASAVNFESPAPKDIGRDKKMNGGAGLADLLCQDFASEHMRLVYPAGFTKRSGIGSLAYDENICLMSSGNRNSLMAAVSNMRSGKLADSDVKYNYFRGRSVIVPQISVRISGNNEWVSLGTTLGDVISTYGLGGVTLKRRFGAGLFTVYCSDKDMPLIAGDEIY